MYASEVSARHPDRTAFVMAATGARTTYRTLESRANRLARLLFAEGLRPGDHYAVFMENNDRYLECYAAGERSGLYYTCVNSYLTAGELAYILENSETRILITSRALLGTAKAALAECGRVTLCLVVEGEDGLRSAPDARYVAYDQAVARYAEQPLPEERLGAAMLYSSGTTGRPKGVLRPLPNRSPSEPLPVYGFLSKIFQCAEDMVYLSPAPLFHSAPHANVSMAIRSGGTVVLMEEFDPERYLQLIEKYRVTHSQVVPTMFSRLLKLPEQVRHRYDLTSLRFILHSSAPCPIQIKEKMIAWWGPIIHECYGATEGLGFALCDTEQWLSHPGTVGKVVLGDLHVLDQDMVPCAKGVTGEIWFKTASPFVYFNDPERTQSTRSSDGTMTTVGDVGYVDEDGFLFLTDRSNFTIICGGVNIYPQECENLLISHPEVADAAVFGVPNEDMGEEVKAVVQLVPGVRADAELESSLLQFCRQNLAPLKCPASFEFVSELPRLPTGKLYKGLLREKYWLNHGKSRIV